MALIFGLKMLRSEKGVVEPNKYWHRPARAKCTKCGLNIRSNNHKCGSK